MSSTVVLYYNYEAGRLHESRRKCALGRQKKVPLYEVRLVTAEQGPSLYAKTADLSQGDCGLMNHLLP